MSFSGWCCQLCTGAYGAARLGGRRVSLVSLGSSCGHTVGHCSPAPEELTNSLSASNNPKNGEAGDLSKGRRQVQRAGQMCV